MKTLMMLLLAAVLITPFASALARPMAVSDQHPQGIHVAEPRQNSEICWVGDVPDGLESQLWYIKVTNQRKTPIMLEVDGSPIYVMKRRSGQEAHLPHGVIVDIGGQEHLQTVLWPGDSCFITPRPKSMDMVRNEGYDVMAEDVSVGQLVDSWLPVTGPGGVMGYKNVNDGFLLRSCEVDTVKYRGKAKLPVVFKVDESFSSRECS